MRYCRGPWAAFCLPQKCQRLFASEIKSEPSVKTVFANHQMEYESHCATNRSGVAWSSDRKLLHSIMKCLILGVLPKWDKLLKGSVVVHSIHSIHSFEPNEGGTWHVADGMCRCQMACGMQAPHAHTSTWLQLTTAAFGLFSFLLFYHRLNLLTFSAFIRISLAFSRYPFRIQKAKRQVGATSNSCRHRRGMAC